MLTRNLIKIINFRKCIYIYTRYLTSAAYCDKRAIHSTDSTYFISKLKRPIRQNACGGGKRNELMDPACKVAIITGGASGIGFASACELLKNKAYRVVLTGNNKGAGEHAVKTLNDGFGQNKATFLGADVTDVNQLRSVFQETIKRFEQVDILFNNAGMMDDKRWELSVDTNIIATINGTLLALEYMGKQNCGGGGVVIQCAATHGFDPCIAMPIYSATQSGIISTARSFGDRYHLGRTCVRVVALCAGVTDTVMLRQANTKLLQDDWLPEMKRQVNNGPCQEADVVGKAFVHVVRYASSGSVWIIDDSKLHLVTFPDMDAITMQKAQYK